MSHSRSVAMQFWPAMTLLRWSSITRTTGPGYMVMPNPQVPSSAVTTQAAF